MIRFLLRTGVRRGVFGGSRAWTVVAVAALGVRLLRKLAGSEPEVVFREELAPGEAFVIANAREADVVPEPS